MKSMIFKMINGQIHRDLLRGFEKGMEEMVTDINRSHQCPVWPVRRAGGQALQALQLNLFLCMINVLREIYDFKLHHLV